MSKPYKNSKTYIYCHKNLTYDVRFKDQQKKHINTNNMTKNFKIKISKSQYYCYLWIMSKYPFFLLISSFYVASTSLSHESLQSLPPVLLSQKSLYAHLELLREGQLWDVLLLGQAQVQIINVMSQSPFQKVQLTEPISLCILLVPWPLLRFCQ